MEGKIEAYLRVSFFSWVLFAQSGGRLGERSGKDLGDRSESRFWKAKSQRIFEYSFSVGYCLPALGGVWESNLGAIWEGWVYTVGVGVGRCRCRRTWHSVGLGVGVDIGAI